jgi:hypothetical protein
LAVSSHEPGTSRARQQPEQTSERRLTSWQRAVRWVLWLTFLGLAVANSQRVQFSGLEWLALVAALGFSIWCMAKPLGGPKVKLTKPQHLCGSFESRTSWGLVLIGALLVIGGAAGLGAAVYDLASGRASIGDVVHDIAIFVEGWIAELIAGISYDAELEKTHAYALFLLLIPGLIMLWLNLVPALKRGSAFSVESDGSVLVRQCDSWEPLLEYQYSTVVADGATVAFTPPQDGPVQVTLPQARVFCEDNGARLKAALSAEFFTALLASRGFRVEASGGSSFTARRV